MRDKDNMGEELQKITRVGFLIYDPHEELVLIHKRGKWDYFGGDLKSVDLSDPEYALSRELYEELGISVNKDCIKILPSIDRHKNERMYYILFPKYRTPDFRLGEGSGFIWFSFDQALSLDTDTGLKEYLRKLKDIVKP